MASHRPPEDSCRGATAGDDASEGKCALSDEGKTPTKTTKKKQKKKRHVRRKGKKRRGNTFVCCSASSGPVCRIAAKTAGMRFSDSKADQQRARGKIIWVANAKELRNVSAALSQKAAASSCDGAGPMRFVSKIFGSKHACEKIATAKQLNLGRRLALRAHDFGFWPETFVLPNDRELLEHRLEKGSKGHRRKSKSGRGRTTFILKPSSASQGDGIFLVQSTSDLRRCGALACGSMVGQRYLANPMLIGGLKFDLRLYVLVSSVRPLRVHLCREGLVRFATSAYEAPQRANLSKATMHLTNYTLNKHSADFVHGANGDPTGGDGSKRTLTQTFRDLVRAGILSDAEAVWERIKILVAHTMQSLAPLFEDAAKQEARRMEGEAERDDDCAASARKRTFCGVQAMEDLALGGSLFQIFGLDVMLDVDGEPYLLEVNNNPSMRVDTIWPVELEAEAEDQGQVKDSTIAESKCSSSSEGPGTRQRSDVCRCMDSHMPHIHEDSAVDIAIKAAVLTGAMRVLTGSDSPQAAFDDVGAKTRHEGVKTYGNDVHDEADAGSHVGNEASCLARAGTYDAVLTGEEAPGVLVRVARLYSRVVGSKRRLDSFKWRKVISCLTRDPLHLSAADLNFRNMRMRVSDEGGGSVGVTHFTEMLVAWAEEQDDSGGELSLGQRLAEAVSALEGHYC